MAKKVQYLASGMQISLIQASTEPWMLILEHLSACPWHTDALCSLDLPKKRQRMIHEEPGPGTIN